MKKIMTLIFGLFTSLLSGSFIYAADKAPLTAPQTGDSINVVIIVAIIAVVALVTAVLLKKKSNK